MAKLSSDRKYVTVEKGDTLSAIASKYGKGASYKQLAAINNISNPNYIYVGQKIYLTNSGSSTSKASNSNQAKIVQYGLQSNADGVLFATWSWSKANTANYEIWWEYDTGDGVWFIGTETTTEHKHSTYSIPSNANRVRFWVRPISKTYKVNDKETYYWTASWSNAITYNVSTAPPTAPSSAPNIAIEKYKLTVSINNINATDLHATGVQFQIVKNDKTVYKTAKATINTDTNYVSYSCTVAAGAEYKVRCRAYRGSYYSEWTDYSGNEQTIPAVPTGFTTCKATSESSVYLKWSSVTAADSYDIEYAVKKEYFDRTDHTTTKNGITQKYYEFVGLEGGEEYFFRVRAVNEKGNSAWSAISSVPVGKEPEAPTTWSSSTTVVTGEKLTLYWVHNSEDNSSQTYAELELYINGLKEVYTIQNSADEDEEDKTSFYDIDTAEYDEGVELQWRVRTAGVTKVYGDWSIQRTVDIYSPPSLELQMNDVNGDAVNILKTFPFDVYALAGPTSQVPTGYNLVITANETYETTDHIGNAKTINKGDSVYSKYFDISTSLSVTISAGDVDLVNNMSYTLTCVVSMDSGLTAEASIEFSIAWTEMEYTPDAEISLDADTLTAYIKPYCELHTPIYYKVSRTYYLYTRTEESIDLVYGIEISGAITTTGEQVYEGTTADGEEVLYCEVTEVTPIEDVMLSVYRREFDGSFTEIATGISGGSNTFVADPHPALDYARYRIVSVANDTGTVNYYDMPGYPVGEKAIIIQWDEEWSSFDVTNEDAMSQPAWSGSLLRLPYNIDVSDKYGPDVELIKYIGRKHPVSYYGTQIGETATWNVVIDKKDEDTIYALRRLAIWMGDVYVREPSGSGYWANVNVSFSQKHLDLTIPVTIDITRVEGGA